MMVMMMRIMQLRLLHSIADPEPDELSDLDAYRSPTECAPSTRNADASLSQPATTTTTTAADTGAGKTTAPETEPWRRLVVEDSWDLVRAVFPRYLRKPDMDAERRALTRRCLVYALQQANLFDPARWMTASAGLLEALGHAACWAYQLPMPAATRAVALETLHPDSGNRGTSCERFSRGIYGNLIWTRNEGRLPAAA
jgi:hypothetical protein